MVLLRVTQERDRNERIRHKYPRNQGDPLWSGLPEAWEARSSGGGAETQRTLEERKTEKERERNEFSHDRNVYVCNAPVKYHHIVTSRHHVIRLSSDESIDQDV